MTSLINLTPHPIHICGSDGNVIRTIQPEKVPARVASKTIQAAPVDGIPVTITEFGSVEGLPEPAADVVYIVSMLVQQALPERTDLLRPDTGPANVVRDAEGKIVGVKALAR